MSAPIPTRPDPGRNEPGLWPRLPKTSVTIISIWSMSLVLGGSFAVAVLADVTKNTALTLSGLAATGTALLWLIDLWSRFEEESGR